MSSPPMSHDGDADDQLAPLLPLPTLASVRTRHAKPPTRKVTTLACAAIALVWLTFHLPWEKLAQWRLRCPVFAESQGAGMKAILYGQNSTDGRESFSSADISPVVEPFVSLSTLVQKSFNNSACEVQWLVHGTLCSSMLGRWNAVPHNVDFVYLWSNNSQYPLSAWRDDAAVDVASQSPSIPYYLRKVTSNKAAHHFRDHDELRYSIRSVLDSVAGVGTIHVAVADSAAAAPEEESNLDYDDRTAFVPTWLDRSAIALNGSHPDLRLHPQSTFFKARCDSNFESCRSWRRQVVPSFNSIAIESQMANIVNDGNAMVMMNDDFFLLKKMSVSDFVSPLFGPVIRLLSGLVVNSIVDPNDDKEGEWVGLHNANLLLDTRFGQTPRPYVVHQAKTFDVAILREASDLWRDAFELTASSRFRGSKTGEVQMAFAVTHYHIERHREALLWSFFVAKHDIDHDGQYSWGERIALLKDFGFDNIHARSGSQFLVVARPKRFTTAYTNRALESAGLSTPISTAYFSASQDGSLLMPSDHDPFRSQGFLSFSGDEDSGDDICRIGLERCFGAKFFDQDVDVQVNDVFRTIAFADRRCGDCFVAHLVGESGRTGLKAFLPLDAEVDQSPATRDDASIPLGHGILDYADVNFAKPNKSIVSAGDYSAYARWLLMRYAYVLGETATYMQGYRSAMHASNIVNMLDTNRDYAMAALNDDQVDTASDAEVGAVTRVLREWAQRRWPERSPYEMEK